MGYDELKNALPDILPSTNLKKESETSYSGPCPKCGGNDRFVYKTDSKRFWCRGCRPPEEIPPGDKIDFHCWLENSSVKDLAKRYIGNNKFPANNSLKGHSPAELWQRFSKEQINEKQIFNFLMGKRKISHETVKKLIKEKKVSYCEHALRKSLVVSYKDFQGNVKAVQYISLEGNFNGLDSNKLFSKGSKPSQSCFFQCGAALKDAKIIVLTEAAINAMSGLDCMENVCFLARAGFAGER